MKLASLISGCTDYTSLLSIKDKVKREENPNIPSRETKEVKFFKSLAPPLVAAFLTLSPICGTPVSIGQTIDIQRGATLFRQTCIGCHDAGGNIIQPVSIPLGMASLYVLLQNQINFLYLPYSFSIFFPFRGQLYTLRIYREMELTQKKKSTVSHTMAKEECLALVKSACQEASAHLELVWKMKRSRYWPSLSNYRLIKGGLV